MTKADIAFAEGQINPGSIGDAIYVAFKSDISAWPTITDDLTTATAAGALSGYTGNFTMKTGKIFIKLYNTQGEGNISFETVGEKDGKLFKNKLEFKYPKITDDIRAYAKYTLNTDCVFIVKHAGKYYVIGSPDYPVESASTGDSGKKPEDGHGITFTAEAIDTTPLPVYSGNLDITGGTLNCSTGAFTPAA